VLANGEVWVDNRSIDVRAVRANVERMSAENPDSRRADAGKRDGAKDVVVEVADQVHLGGIYNITFSTTTENSLDAREVARRHTSRVEDHGIDLAPMLDFTINLLIFFIITTSFIKEPGRDGIQGRSLQHRRGHRESGNLLIAVRANNGDIWIDRRQIDLRDVRAESSSVCTSSARTTPWSSSPTAIPAPA
jgi:biopolymer transport protein ExbD